VPLHTNVCLLGNVQAVAVATIFNFFCLLQKRFKKTKLRACMPVVLISGFEAGADQCKLCNEVLCPAHRNPFLVKLVLSSQACYKETQHPLVKLATRKHSILKPSAKLAAKKHSLLQGTQH